MKCMTSLKANKCLWKKELSIDNIRYIENIEAISKEKLLFEQF